MQMLAQGDVIVAGDGTRWTVDKIDAYRWRDQVRHRSYWLTYNGRAKWFSRRELCRTFGGRDTKNGYWRR